MEARVRSESRLTAFLFLATAFCVTFEQVHWNVAGTVSLADVLALLFIASFGADRLARADARLSRTAAVVLAFFAAFLVVYLIGFYNLETRQALEQFGKGLVKFGIHFLFLAAGVAYLARRSERFYWRTLAWFCGGMAVNGAYGIVQLLAARAGVNLDAYLLSPLTGGASKINVYGAVEGADVYRVNALTGDPNHLGVMLVIPILILIPLYLRAAPDDRLRLPLAGLLAFLLLVEFATLSRSGVLGLAAGLIVLAFPYRRKLVSWAVALPIALAAIPLAYVISQRTHFFDVVLRSRITLEDSSAAVHLRIYELVPDVLASHPLFGLGLNNFSVYYEFVTGKTNWGPHSFYVALLVEGGLIGTALFAAFLWYVFRRLRAARAIGRALAAQRDASERRIRPLAWGLTAALVGTMAGNAFYLTMTFYYFFAFVMLALAAPVVFASRIAGRVSR